jgi:hypothetical protein
MKDIRYLFRCPFEDSLLIYFAFFNWASFEFFTLRRMKSLMAETSTIC